MESCDFSLWAPFHFCPALFGCLMMWVGGRFPETCNDVVPWSHVSNVQAFPSILLGTPFVNVECIACHLEEKTGLSRSHKGVDYVLSTPVIFRNSSDFIPRVCLSRYLLRPLRPVRVCSALDFKSAFPFLQVRSLQTDEQRSIIREANAERNRCVSV